MRRSNIRGIPKFVETIEIGYIGRAQGIKGEVYLRLYAGKADWVKEPKSFQLKPRNGQAFDGTPEKMRPHKEGLVIKFKESPDRNFSETLVGAKVFLPLDLYQSKEDQSPYYHELIGLEVFDTDKKLLGQITKVLSTAQQDVIEITNDRGHFLAPYVDAFIVSQDLIAKQLVMDLPVGLQEL